MPSKKQQLFAFGYARVSVDEEDGHNASISSQRDAIVAYAEREGIADRHSEADARAPIPIAIPRAVSMESGNGVRVETASRGPAPASSSKRRKRRRRSLT